MKWWVALLALLVLLAFSVFSVFYVRNYVNKKPYGIILFVANGLDLNLLQRARQEALDRGQNLQIDRLDKLASLEVKGLGQFVPDEAAASTALACGRRVQNGCIGQTAQGVYLDSLIYAAQRSGRATGLVSTSDLTMPTPASFYNHGVSQPGEALKNAAALIDSGKMNVVLGGGAQYFLPANVTNEYGRLDGRNLLKEAESRGYQTVRTLQELEQVPMWRQRWIFGLFSQGPFVFSTFRNGTTAMPTLSAMTRQAIRCLQYNFGGYFLVVEHGLIATAAKNNWTQLSLDEVSELDSAIGTAMDYAGSKSLVIVTNNYSLGAMEFVQDQLRSPQIQGTLPVANSAWLSGPGGPPMTPQDKTWLSNAYRNGYFSSVQGELTNPSPALRFAREAEPTTALGWVAARGMGSDSFSGFLDNTEIYGRLKRSF